MTTWRLLASQELCFFECHTFKDQTTYFITTSSHKHYKNTYWYYADNKTLIQRYETRLKSEQILAVLIWNASFRWYNVPISHTDRQTNSLLKREETGYQNVHLFVTGALQCSPSDVNHKTDWSAGFPPHQSTAGPKPWGKTCLVTC